MYHIIRNRIHENYSTVLKTMLEIRKKSPIPKHVWRKNYDNFMTVTDNSKLNKKSLFQTDYLNFLNINRCA